jgi:aminopeptidase N
LAHQWYGDDVTQARWRHIWLNEGFAEFSSWLWDEHRGTKSAAAHLTRLLQRPASDGVWNPPPADPGNAAHIFADSVYDRGAGALQALREKLGDRSFFAVMRGWVAEHSYGNARVGDFVRYAEQVTGRDLDHFFYVWLFRAAKPGHRLP